MNVTSSGEKEQRRRTPGCGNIGFQHWHHKKKKSLSESADFTNRDLPSLAKFHSKLLWIRVVLQVVAETETLGTNVRLEGVALISDDHMFGSPGGTSFGALLKRVTLSFGFFKQTSRESE